MAVVGPGAQPEHNDDIHPLLEGASEFEYVTILNPLTDDFAIRVAQDIPVNMPFNIAKDKSGKMSQMTNTDADARQIYGLNLKNPDFQGRRHITNSTIIPAGQTINLKGNEAQTAVKQLVAEILQREGKSRMVADPTLRNEVEQRIIIRRGSVQELMDMNLQSVRGQIDQAVKQSNEHIDEQAFPTISEPAVGNDASGSENPRADIGTPERRGPGRPKAIR